jgi:hypothetical protein
MRVIKISISVKFYMEAMYKTYNVGILTSSCVVSYGPIHKEGLCPSSGYINKLMMTLDVF